MKLRKFSTGLTEALISFFLMQLFTRGVTILTTLFMLGGDIIPFSGWGIPFNICLCLIFAIIFYIAYKNAEKISDFVNKIVEKLKKRKLKVKRQ